MSSVLLKNNNEEDGPVIAPVHEDGTGYAYCMYFNGNSEVAFADTPDELINYLAPGYTELSEDDRDVARIRVATSAAAQVQAEVLYDVTPEDVTQEEWAILNAPRSIEQPRADWWTTEVPLVVVETAYAPYTDVPRPASGLADGVADASNLWWIRPMEEEDLLVSLAEVGYLSLLTNRFESE